MSEVDLGRTQKANTVSYFFFQALIREERGGSEPLGRLVFTGFQLLVISAGRETREKQGERKQGHLEVECNHAVWLGMFCIFCNCPGIIYPKLNQKCFLKVNLKTVHHPVMARTFFVHEHT